MTATTKLSFEEASSHYYLIIIPPNILSEGLPMILQISRKELGKILKPTMRIRTISRPRTEKILSKFLFQTITDDHSNTGAEKRRSWAP
jgi:hypothetical protein